jgi:hypothetical protein
MRTESECESMKRDGFDRSCSAVTAMAPGIVGVEDACGRISRTRSNAVSRASTGRMLACVPFMLGKARRLLSGLLTDACHTSSRVGWVLRSGGGNRLTSVRSRGRTVSGTNTVSASLRTSLARRSEERWIGSGRERPLCAAAVSRSRSATAPGPIIGIQ